MTMEDIGQMPRGGPSASWFDRLLQTDRLEYLDRDDMPDRKRLVIRSLHIAGKHFGLHRASASIALNEVADVPNARILELGAGHGGLSRALLRMSPTVRVTVSDIESSSVAGIAKSGLGRDPRADVRRIDATDIELPDNSYDLAVFALSFHHLPPEQAYKVFAEGTRVAKKLLVIDLQRPAPIVHLLGLAFALPFTVIPLVHDGFISSLRAYSTEAMRFLANHASPDIEVQPRLARLSLRLPRAQVILAVKKHA